MVCGGGGRAFVQPVCLVSSALAAVAAVVATTSAHAEDNSVHASDGRDDCLLPFLVSIM